MNIGGGEAADQLVRMMLSFGEVSVRLGGSALKNMLALSLALAKKPDKEAPDYCLATFDDTIKRIVTMGASAGCYVIISIAQASVEEGGLPSMLRSAMSTKILFRPTLEEGRLMWPGPSLETLAVARKYVPGDAWFSSTDGEHDAPSYVHFPRMDFPVYAELGRQWSERGA